MTFICRKANSIPALPGKEKKESGIKSKGSLKYSSV